MNKDESTHESQKTNRHFVYNLRTCPTGVTSAECERHSSSFVSKSLEFHDS